MLPTFTSIKSDIASQKNQFLLQSFYLWDQWRSYLRNPGIPYLSLMVSGYDRFLFTFSADRSELSRLHQTIDKLRNALSDASIYKDLISNLPEHKVSGANVQKRQPTLFELGPRPINTLRSSRTKNIIIFLTLIAYSTPDKQSTRKKYAITGSGSSRARELVQIGKQGEYQFSV